MRLVVYSLTGCLLCSTAVAKYCVKLPTCEELGYIYSADKYPNSRSIKCPFDTTQGKCVFEAAIGQIAYFSKAPASGSGWLKCDGATYSTTKYPDLFTRLLCQFPLWSEQS